MRTAARIIDTVEKLTKKYDTRDPYELCKCLGIKIHFYDMEKKLKGFFFDIVNIGLHFILKNVRPYAASCSEA